VTRRDAVSALSLPTATLGPSKPLDAVSTGFRGGATASDVRARVLVACNRLCHWLGRGNVLGRHDRDRDAHGGASGDYLHGAAIRIARYILAPVHYQPHNANEARRIQARAARMLELYRPALARALVTAPPAERGDLALAVALGAAVLEAVRDGLLDGDAAAVATRAVTRAGAELAKRGRTT
jgi:hypothetical protein